MRVRRSNVITIPAFGSLSSNGSELIKLKGCSSESAGARSGTGFDATGQLLKGDVNRATTFFNPLFLSNSELRSYLVHL